LVEWFDSFTNGLERNHKDKAKLISIDM